jgi:hypothetical protein
MGPIEVRMELVCCCIIRILILHSTARYGLHASHVFRLWEGFLRLCLHESSYKIISNKLTLQCTEDTNSFYLGQLTQLSSKNENLTNPKGARPTHYNRILRPPLYFSVDIKDLLESASSWSSGSCFWVLLEYCNLLDLRTQDDKGYKLIHLNFQSQCKTNLENADVAFP